MATLAQTMKRLGTYFEQVERATDQPKLVWHRNGSHGQDGTPAFWKNGTLYC